MLQIPHDEIVNFNLYSSSARWGILKTPTNPGTLPVIIKAITTLEWLESQRPGLITASVGAELTEELTSQSFTFELHQHIMKFEKSFMKHSLLIEGMLVLCIAVMLVYVYGYDVSMLYN